MAPRFRPGAIAYAKDGRTYVVDDVADGVVYCSSSGGAETEFAEAQLLNETEWAARSDGRRATLYARLKQSPAYVAPSAKLDRTASEQALAKVERLSPGILDFISVTVATRIMAESSDRDLVSGLSIARCREVFEAAKPEIRASLLAGVLGMAPDVLVGAGRLGDNLMRALIDKGLTDSAAAFKAFLARRRQ